MNLSPTNWSNPEDGFSKQFYDIYVKQFWLPEEIPLANDTVDWSERLTDDERWTFTHASSGLNLLDTLQGEVGMPALHALVPGHIAKATIQFQGMMEDIHARSYSVMNKTYLTPSEELASVQWAANHPLLQEKVRVIREVYAESGVLWSKMAASVLLESALFYSGFFYPLYLAGQGKMVASGEIFSLILRDEALTDDHELLTPGGWKNISSITTDDLVAQWLPENGGGIEFAHPVKVSSHEAPYTWAFVSEQGHVRQTTSPNHRMLLQRRGYAPGSAYEDEVVLAGDIPQSRLNPYARFINAAPRIGGSASSLTPQERLMIAIQADGSFDTTTLNSEGRPRRDGSVSGFVPCTFSLSKPLKIERLKSLAEEAGWELRRYSDAPRKGNVQPRQTLHLMVPREFPRDKRLASIRSLEDVSVSWCQDFIEELAMWDGHKVKENADRITWGSVVEDNAKWVQAVAALAGYRTHYTVREDHRSDTYNDYHRVQIHKSLAHSGAQSVAKTKVDEPREVYAVQVPSSFLLTRNDGAVTVTGNCQHGIYIGVLAQEELRRMDADDQDTLRAWFGEYALRLYRIELAYTEELYERVGLVEDVKRFVRYNFNLACDNLGLERLFEDEEINPIVANGLRQGVGTHDFFSVKGSSYAKLPTAPLTEAKIAEAWDV